MNVSIVRLGPLTRQVARLADAQERVARALEVICQSMGLSLEQGPAPKDDDPTVHVSYSSDQDTAEREAEEELVRLGIHPQEVMSEN